MAEPTKKSDPFGQLEQEVPEELHPVLQYITDNLKYFAIGIGAILVIVAAYAAFSAYQSSQEEKAENELGAILVATDAPDKIAKLDNYLKSAPDRLAPNARLALADALMEQQDYQRAAEQWAKLKDEQEGFRYVAWLGQTKCLMMAGQPEQALQELSKLKGQAPEEYKMVIDRQLGEAAEAAGQYAEAIRTYQELASMVQPADRAYLQSRIKDLEGKL